jgi:tRNA threonylcarbamoyladenosine biosynthesis protein TsaB
VNVLGIDTSTPASAVAVLRRDGAAFARDPGPEATDGPPRHSQELMPAIAGAISEAELDWTDLDSVAVGVGPGAFTGLRIGVATAHALAAAHDLELRPVSSLAALAAGIDAPQRLALIDARRGELFAALYEAGRELWAPLAARPERVAELVRESGFTPLAAGNGAIRCMDALVAGGVRVASPGDDGHVLSALCVCRLALDTPPVPPEAVLPRYLREPDVQTK